MVKKVIQVPVDEGLLRDLDSMSRKRSKTRSALIRQACINYLQQVKEEELDQLYQRGYMKIPEEPEVGNTQIAVSGEILSREPW